MLIMLNQRPDPCVPKRVPRNACHAVPVGGLKSYQLLSSLVVVSLVLDAVPEDLMGPNVQRQSRVRFRRPAIGVSGQESLSSSEEEESRFSPVRGCFGRGELSSDEKVVDDLVESDFGVVDTSSLEGVGLRECDMAEEFESDDSVEASVESVDVEDSRSECAMVYFVVLISSSSGVRKDTRFSAGNMGLEEVILRGMIDLAGLLASIETRLCGCLYGIDIVAESCEADVSADDRVEAELGVVALLDAFGTLLFIESIGLEGRSDNAG